MNRTQQTSAPTYKSFLMLSAYSSERDRDDMMNALRAQPRPDTLCGERVPDSLNFLTYGQLDDLRSLDTEGDVVFSLCDIIFGKKLDVYSEDVNKVFGFVNFCSRELDRINGLFSSMKTDYSSEEIAAGVKDLSFGSFGVLDWYAKRMGITDQNEVRGVAWVRIYFCMLNDHKQQEYERRLQKIYLSKGNTPKKRR